MIYPSWILLTGVFNRKEKEKSPGTEVENGSQLVFWVNFFFFYWYTHHELNWLVYSIEEKKNHPEQKLQKEANSCSGWLFSIDIPIMNYIDWCFNRKKERSPWKEVEKRSQILFRVISFSFSTDIPIMNYIDWCLNREKEKSPWTEVGCLFFIDSCSFSSFQKAKALDCGSNGSRDIEFLPSLTPFKKLWVPQPQPIIYRLGLRDSKFFSLTKLSQHPKVWSKNGLHFWTRRKILIKSKTFRFLHHDDHDDHDHDHHDHHDTKI